METLVTGRMPRTGLLLLPLLLCFGPETAGTINPNALKAIVDHVHQFRPVAPPDGRPINQYAVAIVLPQALCRSISLRELQNHLPVSELQEMKANLLTNTLYEGNHIVAARPNQTQAPHSEWQMVGLDKNKTSPVSRLLDKARGQGQCTVTRALADFFSHNRYTRWFLNNICGWNSCFVFFTYYSPCLGVCLHMKTGHRIQDLMDAIFGAIESDYRALAFKEIYPRELGHGKQATWNAWRTLCNVPMYQCDDQGCHSCEEKDVNKNPCLKEVKNSQRQSMEEENVSYNAINPPSETAHGGGEY